MLPHVINVIRFQQKKQIEEEKRVFCLSFSNSNGFFESPNRAFCNLTINFNRFQCQAATSTAAAKSEEEDEEDEGKINEGFFPQNLLLQIWNSRNSWRTSEPRDGGGDRRGTSESDSPRHLHPRTHRKVHAFIRKITPFLFFLRVLGAFSELLHLILGKVEVFGLFSRGVANFSEFGWLISTAPWTAKMWETVHFGEL